MAGIVLLGDGFARQKLHSAASVPYWRVDRGVSGPSYACHMTPIPVSVFSWFRGLTMS